MVHRIALVLLLLASSAHAATYTVSSSADSGAGTLRQAILDANANPGADNIVFTTATVVATASMPEITDVVHIDGSVGSDANLVLALAYRTAFTVLGGYITAWLAPANKLRLAVILGIVGTLAAVAGAIAMWSVGYNWYPVALAALALPSTALGGWLFTRASR